MVPTKVGATLDRKNRVEYASVVTILILGGKIYEAAHSVNYPGV
jgi:hypothetical protein